MEACWLLIVAFGSLLGSLAQQVDFRYHGYQEMGRMMREIADQHPNRTSLHSIGRSVQGRELWVLELGDPPRDTGDLRPNVKLVANMHGNEGLGRELLLHLAQHLLESEDDIRAKELLSTSRIHLLPSLNPDGFEESTEGQCQGQKGRKNAHGFDLNRNFPDRLRQGDAHNLAQAPAIQPETRAVMDWMESIQFVLSANLHGGALVASFPYEGSLNPQMTNGRYEESLSPDDDILRHLALNYATRHGRMAGYRCYPASTVFPQGITNGAAWYSVLGSIQDYSYAMAACLEITLELSCCKFPEAWTLRNFWEENRSPLIEFLLEAKCSVKGYVTDALTSGPLPATMWIAGRQEASFQADGRGRYWRVLLSGDYQVEVRADGYNNASVPFRISYVCDKNGPTRLDIQMWPVGTEVTTMRSTTTDSTTARTTTAASTSPETEAMTTSAPIVALSQSTAARLWWDTTVQCCVVLVLVANKIGEV